MIELLLREYTFLSGSDPWNLFGGRIPKCKVLAIRLCTEHGCGLCLLRCCLFFNPRKAAEFRLPRTAKRCHLTLIHLTHINDTLFCSFLEKMIGLVNRTYLSCVCWDSLLELLQ